MCLPFQGLAAEVSGDDPEVWILTGTQVGASFGAALAGGGDLNGDGFADLVLGEGGFRTEDGARRGRLQVFFGSTRGFGGRPGQVLLGEGDDVGLGSWVGIVGDINRDGFADVGVTSVSVDRGPYQHGRVEVWRGSPRGMLRDSNWGEARERQGAGVWLVAGAGDVNGDGFADVVFGAGDPEGSPPSAGRLQVFHGSADGLSPVAAWERRGTQENEHYGARAQAAGDVNGDGYGDLIVGTMDHDGRAMDEGMVELFLGSSTGLQSEPLWRAEYVPTTPVGPARAERQLFGNSVAGAGDVNRDGFSDVLAGGAYIDHGEDDEGRALLWLGRREGPAQSFSWGAQPRQPRASFGHQVAGVGDVDGDGYPEVVVTAPHLDHGALNEGVAALYAGGARGLSDYPVWSADGDQALAAFGSTLTALGDVNRDGYADFAVGSDRWVEKGRMVGQVRVFYGRRGGLTGSSGWNRAPSPWERVWQGLGDWGEQTGWVVASGAVLITGLGVGVLLRAASAYQRSRRQMLRLRQRVEALARTGESASATAPESRWRRVAEELRSSLETPPMTVRGLVEVLTTSVPWAEEFAKSRGLRLKLHLPGSSATHVRMDAPAADALEATIRVALANVVQHAQASHAWLELELLENHLRLEVGDDGVGFDEVNVGRIPMRDSARHGLTALKSRLRGAGGRMEIVSQPGRGSRVKVWIPTKYPELGRAFWRGKWFGRDWG